MNEPRSFSQDDIEFYKECLVADTWEHAIGYLMYSAAFPTRIDITYLTHAMKIVFPITFSQERKEFLAFRTRVNELDSLFYEFSQKLGGWLEQGIDETHEEDVYQPTDKELKIFREKAPQWHQRNMMSKDVQKHIAGMARRKNKENSIPKRVNSEVVFNPKTGKEWRRKIRWCPRCQKRLPPYQRYCSIECKKDLYNPELVEKYFPNAHSNGS